MTTLWVDFQNEGQDGVRLICYGTLQELSAKGIRLYDGLELSIWQESDEQENLVVDAVVKYSDIDMCWVATYNRSDLKVKSNLS